MKTIRYPTQAIEIVLADLDFPATKAAILRRAQEGTIKLGSSNEEVKLSDFISRSSLNEFDSVADVAEEVGRLLEGSY